MGRPTGTATRSSTSCTCGPSPTPTATASATSTGSPTDARLPRRPRRHGDLAAAVLPVTAARRRLRHRRLPHRQPRLRRPAPVPTVPRRGPRPQHPGHHRARRQPHVRSAPVVPATPVARRRGSTRARLLRVERHDRPRTRRPHHLPGLRDVELDVGPGRRVSTSGTASTRTSPTSTSTTPTSRRRMLRRARLLARHGRRRPAPRRRAVPVRARGHELREPRPRPTTFLKRLRTHMDARYPDRMLLAEANQWPEDAAAYFGDGDECHMNFHFPVMPRLFMSLRLENRTPIVDILEQTPEPPPGGQWATFLRNHDELTLEMVTDEERDLMLRAYATDLADAHQPRHPPPAGAAARQRPPQDRAAQRAAVLAARARRSSTTATRSGWATTSTSATATACARRCSGRPTATPASRRPTRTASTCR